MSRRISDAAAAELETAAAWYEAQRPGLGIELIQEFHARLDMALVMPGAGSLAGHAPNGAEVRRYRLKRFDRYSIMLTTVDGTPTVVAFEHSSRRPNRWRHRLT